MSPVLAIVWERPWGLWLLAIPVVMLLAAVRRPRAELRATSDLEPWRSVAASRGGGLPRTPRRMPLSLLLAALACALAALAVAGPRTGNRALRWTAVLDTSPSMHLPLGDASSARTTRIERAVAMARDLAARAGAELGWIAPPHDLTLRADPVEAWFRRTSPPTSPFEAWDVPGTLWVTDTAPADPPRDAGFVAAGGAAVPGTVAVERTYRLDWEGEHLLRLDGAFAPRPVVVEGVLDGPLDRALRAWAAARGFAVNGRDVANAALRIAARGDGPERKLEAGRDGWSALGVAHGTAPIQDSEGDLEVWLSAGGEPLVTAGVGRIHLAWNATSTPSGDPAAFAVSWAKLLDAFVRPPPGVVPLDERQAAGEPRGVPPRATPRTGEDAPRDWILAAFATALALGALLLRTGRA